MKTTISITIEPTTLLEYQKIVEKGNLSKEIEEYMNRVVQTKRSNAIYQDKELLKKDIEIKKREFEKITAQLQSLEKQKEEIEAQELLEEKRTLEEQKDKKDTEKKCAKCKLSMSNNKYAVPGGHICNSCFFSLTGTEAKELGL